MIYQGRIQRVFTIQSGVSQSGKRWEKLDFVFEYFEKPDDRYADRVVLSVMNERIADYSLHEGDQVEIGFGHNIREYNGKYFNEVRIYHFKKLSATPTENQQPQQPQPQTNEGKLLF